MVGRTGLQSLRGVHISLFALGIIGASLVSALVQSRPASAEGFLSKTVECVLGVLVRTSCRESAPASNPAAPANPSNGQSTSPPPASESSSASSVAPSPHTSNQTSQQSHGDVAQDVPLDVQGVATVNSTPELPDAVHRQSFTYQPTFYAAFMYRTFGQATSDTATDTASTIQPSEEGWRIFGIAWYWWAAIAGIAFAILMGVKRKRIRNKEMLSVVK